MRFLIKSSLVLALLIGAGCGGTTSTTSNPGVLPTASAIAGFANSYYSCISSATGLVFEPIQASLVSASCTAADLNIAADFANCVAPEGMCGIVSEIISTSDATQRAKLKTQVNGIISNCDTVAGSVNLSLACAVLKSLLAAPF